MTNEYSLIWLYKTFQRQRLKTSIQLRYQIKRYKLCYLLNIILKTNKNKKSLLQWLENIFSKSFKTDAWLERFPRPLRP